MKDIYHTREGRHRYIFSPEARKYMYVCLLLYDKYLYHMVWVCFALYFLSDTTLYQDVSLISKQEAASYMLYKVYIGL